MTDGIIFTKQDGTFKQEGECLGTHGLFQWKRQDGLWDGGWTVEPLADLLARMSQRGPYRYSAYRILPAERRDLVIKPSCAGCGSIAGIDCQRSVEYIFGRADVAEPLPVNFSDNHQFNLSVAVVTDGKNFGQKKPKTFWFDSVRCAELFLMEQGHCQKSKARVGNGERLLAYLGGSAVVKERKKRAPNSSYLTRLRSEGSVPLSA